MTDPQLRFVLDQDVDVACRAVLIELGHQAWTVGSAGRATADDVDQLIYATEQHAILISHDHRFLRAQRDRPSTRTILLRCDEWRAPALLLQRIPELSEMLYRNPYVHIEMSESSSGTRYQCFFGTEST